MAKSDVLYDIHEELLWVAQQDVSLLTDFFRSDPHLPLVTCGMGGAKPAAHYLAMLYGAQGALAQAVTCYQLNAFSDEALRHSKVLISSSNGRNNDVKFVADRLKRLKHEHAANFTLFDNPDNHVKKVISQLPGAHSVNLYGQGHYGNHHAFVDIDPVVSHFALIYKAVTGKTDFTELDFERQYTYTTNAGGANVPGLGDMEHFVVLYGHYGQPVAIDMDSKLVESGFASLQFNDYRDFTHGRFCFVGNHMERGRTAIVMLVSPREKDMVEKYYRRLADDPKYQVLPSDVPIITLTTAFDSPLASVDLLLQWTKLYLDISAAHGLKDPYQPTCPNIDKRIPQSKVAFNRIFKDFGPLTL